MSIFIAGYRAGAKRCNKNINVLIDFSQDFGDQAKCKELALNQIAKGSKVIFQVAGGCGLGALDAFGSALGYVNYNHDVMTAHAGDGYTVATDIADSLIVRGITARRAHELVGGLVTTAERAGRPLEASDLDKLADGANLARPLIAPLDARASVEAKRTIGSTHPDAVARAISELETVLAARERNTTI